MTTFKGALEVSNHIAGIVQVAVESGNGGYAVLLSAILTLVEEAAAGTEQDITVVLKDLVEGAKQKEATFGKCGK